MKELKQPWINWQSQSAAIQLPDNDPLRDNPLYRRVIGAENLETTVRAQINRWTAARLEKVTAGGIVQHPDHLLRQLFTTTTVNLTSTATQSVGIRPGDEPLRLPMGFWMNNDALLDDLELEVEAPVPATTTALYAQSLATFGFRLEEKAGNFSRPGDTFFAFVVPEAALEDNAVVREMGERGLISPKFAACALMVDFPNPVFSADRARLMRYVPTTATAADSLGDRVAQQILAAAGTLPADSPEARFAAHWNLPERHLARRLLRTAHRLSEEGPGTDHHQGRLRRLRPAGRVTPQTVQGHEAARVRTDPARHRYPRHRRDAADE
ncbi:hypothetical protein RB199_23700 [Streptomyces libani]